MRQAGLAGGRAYTLALNANDREKGEQFFSH
jgi:hypothetical protein